MRGSVTGAFGALQWSILLGRSRGRRHALETEHRSCGGPRLFLLDVS